MHATGVRTSSLPLPPFLAVPIFDAPATRNGQLRLALERNVPLPGLDPRFAEGLVRLQLDRPLIQLPATLPRPAASRRRPIVITPLMEQVEQIVCRVAAARHPMPGNPALGELAGGRGRQSAARTLDRLVALGRIRIEVQDGQRRVHAIVTGHVTGWGPFATGTHAPFSTNPKGTAPLPAPVRLDYKPVENTPFRYRSEPAKLVPTGPASTCQWPLWDDGRKATETPHFCDKPTVTDARGRRTSWCRGHFATVWPAQAQRMRRHA